MAKSDCLSRPTYFLTIYATNLAGSFPEDYKIERFWRKDKKISACGRQDNGKRRAFSELACDIDATVMRLNKGFDQAQPKT